MSKQRLYFLVTNSLHQDQRLHRICGSLSSDGFKVTLVGVRSNKVVYSNKDFKTISLPTFFKSGPLFYLEANLRFFLLLMTKKLNGIVANDLDTLLAAKLIAIIKRKKLFVDLHEYFTEVPELENRSLKKVIWSRLGRFGISNFSHNYTVNSSLAKILSEKYGSHFETIYNYPTEKGSHLPSKKRKTFDIVYVGMVNKGRGLEEVIMAMKDLNDTTLTILGRGDIIDQIRQLSVVLNLTDRIYIEGFVNANSIHDRLLSFDLGINLLKSTSLSYYYSSANKYFDYIMAGVPSLSMRFPEYQRLNREFETSILIDSLDVPQIRASIHKIKSDHNHYTQLKENCAKAKEVFNWKSEEDKLLTIYNSAFNL